MQQQKEGILKPGNWKGRKHSKETIKKMIQSAKGRQSGSKNSQYGTCWIRNPISNNIKKIPKTELELYLIQGWLRGRKIKNTT